MKILFISYDFPFPPAGGSISRDYNLIKQMSKEHELHWINRTIRGKVKKEYKEEMQKYFKEMNIIEWDYRHTLSGLLKSLFSNTPYIITRFKSDEMTKIVTETISRNEFDLILCDHIYLSQYIPDNVLGKIPVIPNNEDCGFTYYNRMTENSGIFRKVYAKSQWKKMLNYEIEVLKQYKVYITTSQKEKELISSYYGEGEIKVIENGVDTEFFFYKQRNNFKPNIVFTAWFKYYPNSEAAVYFAKKVFPLIKKEIPEMEFYIVGKEPPQSVKDLEKTEGIKVTGYVDDVRKYLVNADATVIPLKIGGGTRLKILEAMSMKVPVISTELGAEGLKTEDGTNILIAKSDIDFAEKVVSLCRDKNLANQLSENGRHLVEENYSWEDIGKELNSFLNTFAENFKKKI